MKTKHFHILLLVVILLGITKNVWAIEEPYYTTAKGIELSEEEYHFLTTFFWNGYPDIMTETQYEEFVNLDLLNRKVTIRRTNIPITPFGEGSRSTSHSESMKTLQIGSACSSTSCYNSLMATWTGSPSIRSWDVIGAYLYNVSLISHDTTYVYSTNGINYYNNVQTAYNGIGNSVKLPDVGENIIVNLVFTTTKGGTIFGSYQHAMANTTLYISQNYSFSLGGYGNVLLFYGNATDLYDGMAGVDIDI